MKPKIVIKRQEEVGSSQWGIYVNGKLVGGGYFCKESAEESSREYRQFVCPK